MVRLYEYWRSSASYRLRIALNLLDIPYESVQVDLREGAQRSPEMLARNPQGLVPVLEIDGESLTQSLAILEYLNATRHAGWLPESPVAQAKARALAYAIAMEIHPVCNLRVARFACDEGSTMERWMGHFIPAGLAEFEQMLAPECLAEGPFCSGVRLGLADICLVPQLYNARRWGVDLAPFGKLLAIEARLLALPAFAQAAPQG